MNFWFSPSPRTPGRTQAVRTHRRRQRSGPALSKLRLITIDQYLRRPKPRSRR